ncbi:site-specific integrase [candidate division KSB1 bacterium]|nr:site-specific integrase [candidate division KSB1 bacterium]
MLAVCKDDYHRLAMFLLNTGCRCNEGLGMTWDEVDLGRRQVVVRSAVGKMGKRRTIPINDQLAAVFRNWPGDHTSRLFPKFGPNQVTMGFRRLRRAAGLPEGISVHSLRATFARHLIERGVDISTVSRLLGHSSVKMTEKHYLALDPQHVHSAVNQLDFTSPPPRPDPTQ